MEILENTILDDSVEYEGFVSPTEHPTTLEPVAIDMRFTFSGQDKELECLKDKQFIARAKSIHKQILNYMLDHEYIYRNRYTSGFETRSTTGDTCKAHIHIRFYTTCVVQHIRRTVKDFITKTYDEDTTGNKNFMFKAKTPRDINEYMGYPTKWGLNEKLCGGYSSEKLQLLHNVGKAILQRSIQQNQNKMDKRDETDSLFERLKNICVKNKDTTKSSVELAIVKLYVEEQRNLNRQAVSDKANTLLLSMGILTPQQWLGIE